MFSIRLRGLRRNTHLNGSVGCLVAWSSRRGLYIVDTPSWPRPLLVRLENIDIEHIVLHIGVIASVD